MNRTIFFPKNKFARRAMALLIAMLFFGMFQNSVFSQTGWKAPDSADQIKNPYKGNEKATLAGKKLYVQNCAICHGNKGKGDGMAGMALKPRPANLTKDVVQKQTDGAIFWKMTEGRAPMAAYKEALTAEQRWQLVNFIRSLKK